MTAAENDIEVQETAKAAKELRKRRIYIRQRLAEIQTERAALREELQKIKVQKD